MAELQEDESGELQGDGVSIKTLWAVEMLGRGWTVEYFQPFDKLRWRSPDGQSGSEFYSFRLDDPPIAAVNMAEKTKPILIWPRVPSQK